MYTLPIHLPVCTLHLYTYLYVHSSRAVHQTLLNGHEERAEVGHLRSPDVLISADRLDVHLVLVQESYEICTGHLQQQRQSTV